MRFKRQLAWWAAQDGQSKALSVVLAALFGACATAWLTVSASRLLTYDLGRPASLTIHFLAPYILLAALSSGVILLLGLNEADRGRFQALLRSTPLAAFSIVTAYCFVLRPQLLPSAALRTLLIFLGPAWLTLTAGQSGRNMPRWALAGWAASELLYFSTAAFTSTQIQGLRGLVWLLPFLLFGGTGWALWLSRQRVIFVPGQDYQDWSSPDSYVCPHCDADLFHPTDRPRATFPYAATQLCCLRCRRTIVA